VISMRILLIHPPAENIITTNLPSFVEEERGFYPPLGLMYIAAYLEKHTNHEIKILDTQVEEISYRNLGSKVKKFNPDIVGIQAMTFTFVDSILTAKIVKKVNDNIKIVLGGPHATIYPEDTLSIPEVDYVVLDEGEITFTNLIQNIKNKKKLKKIKGLVFKDKGKIINTGQRGFIKDLNSLPFPARHLTPYKKYFSLIAKRSPITTMMTSRGCPFKCLFCYRPHLGKVFRYRSPKNVVDEMEKCVNMGIHEIFIYDDTFTVNKQRVIDICNEIVRRRLDIGWDIRARVDTVDKKLLSKMKEAGCERIHYGVESASPRILKILRKGIALDQVRKVFKWTKELGINVLAYFMIGSPTETRKEIEKSIEFAKEIDADFVHFSVTTPFPSTDLYFMGIKQGIFTDFWKEFSKNPTKDFQPRFWEEVLSREELVELLNLAYKSFYLRPSYIFKKFLKIRSFKDFKRKTKAGLKIITSRHEK